MNYFSIRREQWEIKNIYSNRYSKYDLKKITLAPGLDRVIFRDPSTFGSRVAGWTAAGVCIPDTSGGGWLHAGTDREKAGDSTKNGGDGEVEGGSESQHRRTRSRRRESDLKRKHNVDKLTVGEGHWAIGWNSWSPKDSPHTIVTEEMRMTLWM